MKDLPTGWLSPTGEFIQCSSYDHTKTARDIAENSGLLKRVYRPDDDLLDAGYVYIGIGAFFHHGWYINWNYHHSLTEEQKSFLRPYFEDEEYIESHTMMLWRAEIGDYGN